MTTAVIGVDIGTSSSKGVLVSTSGELVATIAREHVADRPNSGWVQMDAEIWWEDFVSITRELAAIGAERGWEVAALGVSGMGPCTLVTDSAGEPLYPAILYGVDTRAWRQVDELTLRYGGEVIRERCGSSLSSQAVGPKLQWLSDNEPHVVALAKRLFMPSSWLVFRLTGEYVLDYHSASQCTPLFDSRSLEWYAPWVEDIAPWLELPALKWPGDEAGPLKPDVATQLGLPAGIPVITGTIDAWMEAVSAGAQTPGDLMLMYGTTMFLVNTVEHRVTAPSMWGTVGAYPGTFNLAGGMATSGAITTWIRDLVDTADYATLTLEATESPAGANGLLMLPYFAGERTPIFDPDARGAILGLTLSHTRGDLYRAALEATAMGVRHNLETIEASGGDVRRIVAIGGGTQGGLWTRIVSDVTGREQQIPTKTIGAAFGGAYLAAALVAGPDIRAWNPPAATVAPDPSTADRYSALYELYRELYPATKSIAHALAAIQAL